jgi:sialidase-1
MVSPSAPDHEPPLPITRRAFLHSAAVLSASAAVGLSARASSARAGSVPSIKVLETKVISLDPEYYHGWPTLARRRSGQLVVVWSGGRERHICPFGRVEMMTSDDNGQSWTWPRVLIDSAIDDRDTGVLETAKGTLLVTSFTSLAYEPSLFAAEKKKPGEDGGWPAERLEKWQAAHGRLTAEQRRGELGQWMIRSTDAGVTWSARYPTIVNSPHGPFQLSNGRLLYAGVELWSKEGRVGVCESTDDGQTWRWLAAIPTRPRDTAAAYHELHGVETADGRLIVHIRNSNNWNMNETLQTESTDGGKTWTIPRPIGVWGLPSFLTRLKDGRLLMTYGYRRDPGGCQARLSLNHGRTWSEPLVISADATVRDLGYPSTVELADRTLVTVWYERMKDSPKAVLRQARWTISS